MFLSVSSLLFKSLSPPCSLFSVIAFLTLHLHHPIAKCFLPFTIHLSTILFHCTVSTYLAVCALDPWTTTTIGLHTFPIPGKPSSLSLAPSLHEPLSFIHVYYREDERSGGQRREVWKSHENENGPERYESLLRWSVIFWSRSVVL